MENENNKINNNESKENKNEVKKEKKPMNPKVKTVLIGSACAIGGAALTIAACYFFGTRAVKNAAVAAGEAAIGAVVG